MVTQSESGFRAGVVPEWTENMRRNLIKILAAWVVVGSACYCADLPDVTSVSRRIDQVVEQGCVYAGVNPLGTCTDAEFLRRIWLDLAGRTPPLSDVKKSLSGLDRPEAVQRLLKSPEFAQHWGRLWTEYLTDRRPFVTEGYDGRRLLQFMTQAFRDNQPYAEMVSDLILGEGTSDVSGSVNFLLRYNAEPVPLAGAVSQKFLGLSMQCAECHDHPLARWKQKEFWGLAAHFARLRKMNPTNPEDGESFFMVIERPRGELSMIDKRATPDENGEQPKKTIFPQLPGRPRTDPAKQRRTVLVEWLTKPENPFLSRHLTNLVWERLLGARLVSNLDQWPPESSTTDTELLNLLSEDFSSNHWDMQRLIQSIVLSQAYQRSSHAASDLDQPTDSLHHEKERTHWGRSRIRPLSADQLHLSVGQALGYHHDENDYRLAEATGEEFTQDIPENNLGSLSYTLGRSLSLYNSDYVRGAVEFGSEAAVRLYGPAVGAEHIDRFCLSLLSRLPTTDELEFFQDLGSEGDPRAGLQDIIWVLLNSSEFVTNH